MSVLRTKNHNSNDEQGRRRRIATVNNGLDTSAHLHPSSASNNNNLHSYSNSNSNNQGHSSFLSPAHVNQVPPNYKFAKSSPSNDSSSDDCRYNNSINSIPSSVVDLDETNSITEYCSTFRHSLQLEHEECMRLYENYSFHVIQLHPLLEEEIGNSSSSSSYKKARLAVKGIADARPSLQPNDVVLLRPLEPVFAQHDPCYGNNIMVVPQTGIICR